MQHLLDFIHEHTVDEQLYLVAAARTGELELLWQRREDADHWQLRPRHGEDGWERVHRSELLEALAQRGVDMSAVERELNAMATTQIVFADMVLCDARRVLGRDTVRRAVLGHRDFVGELRAALERLTNAPESESTPPARPSMMVIKGGGDQSEARTGHLSVV